MCTHSRTHTYTLSNTHSLSHTHTHIYTLAHIHSLSPVCVRVHARVCPEGGQERVSDPLEQELEVTVSHLVVVTELRSPGRVGHFLNL